MNTSIIPSDATIVVGTFGVEGIDVSSVPSNVHALQWDGTKGSIEYNDGTNNSDITDLPSWAVDCITQHTTIKNEAEAAEAAEEAYLNSAEGKLEALRNKRNELLAETDYLALSDNTLTTEMLAYRQALRDITNTYSSLDDVVFPTKP